MRKYHVFIGSCSKFEKYLQDNNYRGDEFSEVVIQFDAGHRQGYIPERVDELLIRNNHNHLIVESAHARLGALVEDVTNEDATIVVHNPTIVLMRHLERQCDMGFISLDIEKENRSRISDIDNTDEKIQTVKKSVIGQDAALNEIAKTLKYLSLTNRKKPYVVMLYGQSSVGKTETARAIADSFFDGNVLEQHMSMFENIAHADYLFGGKPNVSTLSYDLNERESNLVFLDEMDKCPAFLRSAFYSLFDSPMFNDTIYEVDISGLLIILTCNYLHEGEIRENLGDPIFFRIDKFIKYEDFSSSAIREIAELELEKQLADVEAEINRELITKEVFRRVYSDGENGRTISSKVRSVIEDALYEEIGQQQDIDRPQPFER